MGILLFMLVMLLIVVVYLLDVCLVLLVVVFWSTPKFDDLMFIVLRLCWFVYFVCV